MPCHERLVAWSHVDNTKLKTNEDQIPQTQHIDKETLEMHPVCIDWSTLKGTEIAPSSLVTKDW